MKKFTTRKFPLCLAVVGIIFTSLFLPRPTWLSCSPKFMMPDPEAVAHKNDFRTKKIPSNVIDPYERGILRMFLIYNETSSDVNMVSQNHAKISRKDAETRKKQEAPRINILPSTLSEEDAAFLLQKYSSHIHSKNAENHLRDKSGSRNLTNGVHQNDFPVRPKDTVRKARLTSINSTQVPECVRFVGPSEMKNPRVCIHSIEVDRVVSGSLRARGHWEIDYVYDMESALLAYPDMQVVDLGCNVGEFTLYAAGMGRHVIAVDVLPSSLNLLRASLTLNDIENNAYSVKMGTHEMYTRRNSTQHSENTKNPDEKPTRTPKSILVNRNSTRQTLDSLYRKKNTLTSGMSRLESFRHGNSAYQQCKKTSRKNPSKSTKVTVNDIKTKDSSRIHMRKKNITAPYSDFRVDLKEFLDSDKLAKLSQHLSINSERASHLPSKHGAGVRSSALNSPKNYGKAMSRSILSVQQPSQIIDKEPLLDLKAEGNDEPKHSIQKGMNESLKDMNESSTNKDYRTTNRKPMLISVGLSDQRTQGDSDNPKSLTISQLVTVVHNAVYKDRTSKLGVYVKPDGNIGGTEVLEVNSPLLVEQRKSPQQVLVDAICLDDLIPLVQAPSVYLKMDVEGSEPHVLECAEKFFQTFRVRFVLMEWLYLLRKEASVPSRASFIIRFMTAKGFIPTTGMGLDVKGGAAYDRGVSVLDVNLWHVWPEMVLWMER